MFNQFSTNFRPLLNANSTALSNPFKLIVVGGGYRRLSNYFKQSGMNHRIACPYTHQQMGAIERRHRQIVETGLSLLSHSHLPQHFWEDAFTTAMYIINRLPTPLLHNQSPYEVVYHKKPDYQFLKIFGCACWPYLHPFNNHKLDFRSKLCIFLGYSRNHNGYICLDTSTGKVYVSHHVVFDEHRFPFQHTSTSSPTSYNTHTASLPLQPISHPPQPDPDTHTVSSDNSLSSMSQDFADAGLEADSPNLDISSNHSSARNSTSPAQQECNSAPPTLQPIHCPVNTHHMITRSKNNIHCPKKLPADVTQYPLPRALLVAAQEIHDEPTCYTKASKSSEWRSALNTEFDALLRNGTWTLVPLHHTPML